MTELDLKWARMIGKKVVLQSQAQGLTTTGTELILKRPGGDRADEVYIRGTPEEPLFVERIEYTRDRQGMPTEQIRTIETMTSQDITLFDEKPKPSGTGTAQAVANTAIEVATVVARGKGKVEVRNGRDQPVIRSASWSEQALMITQGAGDQSKKVITLTGLAQVWDAKSGNLDAGELLEVTLSPKLRKSEPAAAAGKVAGNEMQKREAAASLSSKSFEIERVFALKDVRLVADNRYLTARNRLDVEFLPGTTAPPAAPAGPARDREIATKPESHVKPTSYEITEESADQPAASAATPAASQPSSGLARRPSPKVSVDANRIWARLGPNLNRPGNVNPGGAQAMAPAGGIELIEARLRGNVKFDQENADPSKKASSIEAQAVDVVHQGQAMYHFLAYDFDPSVKKPTDINVPMVHVASDQFELDGPIVLLNQRASYAKVDGPGRIRQWIGSELLKQEGYRDANTGNTPEKPAAKPQLANIVWSEKMEFMGVPSDQNGNSLLAQANFRGKVAVSTTDSALQSDQLDVYFDRQIPLDQVKAPTLGDRTGVASTGNRNQAATRPDVAFVKATGNVLIVNREVDRTKQQITKYHRLDGSDVIYDKASDTFQMQKKGIVRLYERNDGNTPLRRVNPTNPSTKTAANQPSKPFSLTRVSFDQGMSGRLGIDSNPKTAEKPAKDRSAEFFRNVQVMHGQVSTERSDLNMDRPPDDYAFLSSQWLKVESRPDAANKANPRNLLFAQGNAMARTADMSTQGDQIHFDATSQIFHVYGLNGREVSLLHQEKPGSPPSVARGSSLVYNHLTGESQLVDPKTIQLIDPGSGIRPALGPPKPVPVKPESERTPIRLPPSSSKERRSF
jgi:hypothetical protein